MVFLQEKCEERIQRVVSIAKAEISDEKLEELLEQGNYASIFNADVRFDYFLSCKKKSCKKKKIFKSFLAFAVSLPS